MPDTTELNEAPSDRVAASEVKAQRPARLASIINRIEQTVEAETASIRTDMRFDIKASNARKSRYLYELSKAVKAVEAPQLIAEQRDAIIRLREKLVLNETAIKSHLNAVTEVATLIRDAIQNAEADGTYSVGELGRL